MKMFTQWDGEWIAWKLHLTVLQVQCNVFEGAQGDVALTCGGGLRKLSGLADSYENVALVCSPGNLDIISCNTAL